MALRRMLVVLGQKTGIKRIATLFGENLSRIRVKSLFDARERSRRWIGRQCWSLREARSCCWWSSTRSRAVSVSEITEELKKLVRDHGGHYLALFSRREPLTATELLDSSPVPEASMLVVLPVSYPFDPQLVRYHASFVGVFVNRLTRRMQILVLRYSRLKNVRLLDMVVTLRANGAFAEQAMPTTEQQALDTFGYWMEEGVFPEAPADPGKERELRQVYVLLQERSKAEEDVMLTLPESLDANWLQSVVMYAETTILLEYTVRDVPVTYKVNKSLAAPLSPAKMRAKIRAYLHLRGSDATGFFERIFDWKIVLEDVEDSDIESPPAILNERKAYKKPAEGTLLLEPPVKPQRQEDLTNKSNTSLQDLAALLLRINELSTDSAKDSQLKEVKEVVDMSCFFVNEVLVGLHAIKSDK